MRIRLIEVPEPELAPVIPPVMDPIVHEKLLGAVAVRAILVFTPLQALAADAFVTRGIGLTVTVIR